MKKTLWSKQKEAERSHIIGEKAQVQQVEDERKAREQKVLIYRILRVQFDLDCFENGLLERPILKTTDEGITPSFALAPAPSGKDAEDAVIQMKAVRRDLFMMAGTVLGIEVPEDVQKEIDEMQAAQKDAKTPPPQSNVASENEASVQ